MIALLAFIAHKPHDLFISSPIVATNNKRNIPSLLGLLAAASPTVEDEFMDDSFERNTNPFFDWEVGAAAYQEAYAK